MNEFDIFAESRFTVHRSSVSTMPYKSLSVYQSSVQKTWPSRINEEVRFNKFPLRIQTMQDAFPRESGCKTAQNRVVCFALVAIVSQTHVS